jgi:transcriptional regulator with XRE-family HTH domain
MGRPISKRQATTRSAAIGAVVTELRLKKGASYQAVSERVGCADRYMHDIETGRANPTIAILQAISDYHKIRLSSLIRMAEDRYASARRKRKS